MVDFPSSPTTGQPYTLGGTTWTWDGTKWVAQGTGTGVYLPLSGGVMTGDIVLKGDPTLALHPVTKQMFDLRPMIGDNRIINGDMRIDQRNNGASGTAISVYTVDRWFYGATVAAKGTWQRGGAAVGFGACLSFVSSSAYTLLAGDTFYFSHRIEADMLTDFQWGASSAQPVTLSFWVFSSLTGTFGGVIKNTTPDRSYPFSYSIPVANVWTRIVINIPGDTAGTWTLTGNGVGAFLTLSLGTGSTYSAPANAWTAGSLNSSNGAVSVVGTNGATFLMTGVKLEIGSVVTPYNRQTMAKSLADCQRYYQIIPNYTIGGYGVAASLLYGTLVYPTQMRANPTAILTSPSQANAAALAVSALLSSECLATASVTAAGVAYSQAIINLSAEL